jgi:hypothetical protein
MRYSWVKGSGLATAPLVASAAVREQRTVYCSLQRSRREMGLTCSLPKLGQGGPVCHSHRQFSSVARWSFASAIAMVGIIRGFA